MSERTTPLLLLGLASGHASAQVSTLAPGPFSYSGAAVRGAVVAAVAAVSAVAGGIMRGTVAMPCRPRACRWGVSCRRWSSRPVFSADLLVGPALLDIVGQGVSSQWSGAAAYLGSSASLRTTIPPRPSTNVWVRALHATQTWSYILVSCCGVVVGRGRRRWEMSSDGDGGELAGAWQKTNECHAPGHPMDVPGA